MQINITKAKNKHIYPGRNSRKVMSLPMIGHDNVIGQNDYVSLNFLRYALGTGAGNG